MTAIISELNPSRCNVLKVFQGFFSPKTYFYFDIS